MKDEMASLMAAHGLVDPEANDRSALAQCTQHAAYLREEISALKLLLHAYETNADHSLCKAATAAAERMLHEEIAAYKEAVRFMGGCITEKGLEINMPKYHKANKELEHDKLRAGLKRLEWVCKCGQGCAGNGNLCPICDEHEDDGHGPDCWLAALIGEEK